MSGTPFSRGSGPHERPGRKREGARPAVLRGAAGLLLVLASGALLGVDAATVAQLAQGYPLWGLSGGALGTLVVALPVAAWLCGILAALAGRRSTGRRGLLLLAQLGTALVSAAVAGLLLGFTPLGRYEWFMLNGP